MVGGLCVGALVVSDWRLVGFVLVGWWGNGVG